MGAMATLLTLLLLAPDPVATKVPEVIQHLKAKPPQTTQALNLLKEIGTLKKNHVEAKALVKMIRTRKVKKPPEVIEASFLALKGIGSRKVTRSLLAILDHSVLKKDSAVRIGVCRALEGSVDPSAADTLINLMRDKDDHVIAAAAAAAGAYRYEKEAIRKDRTARPPTRPRPRRSIASAAPGGAPIRGLPRPPGAAPTDRPPLPPPATAPLAIRSPRIAWGPLAPPGRERARAREAIRPGACARQRPQVAPCPRVGAHAGRDPLLTEKAALADGLGVAPRVGLESTTHWLTARCCPANWAGWPPR